MLIRCNHNLDVSTHMSVGTYKTNIRLLYTMPKTRDKLRYVTMVYHEVLSWGQSVGASGYREYFWRVRIRSYSLGKVPSRTRKGLLIRLE